jgi:hypothetical protein
MTRRIEPIVIRYREEVEALEIVVRSEVRGEP